MDKFYEDAVKNSQGHMEFIFCPHTAVREPWTQDRFISLSDDHTKTHIFIMCKECENLLRGALTKDILKEIADLSEGGEADV